MNTTELTTPIILTVLGTGALWEVVKLILNRAFNSKKEGRDLFWLEVKELTALKDQVIARQDDVIARQREQYEKTKQTLYDEIARVKASCAETESQLRQEIKELREALTEHMAGLEVLRQRLDQESPPPNA